MEIVVKTPMKFDKLINGMKTAVKAIKAGCTKFKVFGQMVIGFCKTHAPLILLVAGTVLAIGGFVVSYISRKKQGKREIEAKDNEEELRKLKKKHLIINIISVSLFVIGCAANIGSYIISAGRIDALAKALASAMTAGSGLAMASIAAKKDANIVAAEEERLDIARDNFSLRIGDIPCYKSWDGYLSYETFTNLINHLKRRLGLGLRVSWNDVLLQLNIPKTDWGYDIGWSNPEEFNWIVVDPYGNECTDTDQLWASVSGNFDKYRLFFLGMHNLSYFDNASQKYKRPVVEGES